MNLQRAALMGMTLPFETDKPLTKSIPQVVEVAFKAGRVGIYSNPRGLEVSAEDNVIVEAERGLDLGRVVRTGRGMFAGDDQELQGVVSHALSEDLVRLRMNRQLEETALRSCKDKILRHGLNMNLVDVEYQWDHSKLTFYFTSEQRVDFRKLVKDLAAQYHTRIELRQIGVRDAARHVGGYGTCGCQLCCTLFLKRLENITSQYIKDQLITTNATRLTGICGRLKCCLAYERDFYLEELSKFPLVDQPVDTPRGKGVTEKIDIYNQVVYVRFRNEDIERYSVDEVQPVVSLS